MRVGHVAAMAGLAVGLACGNAPRRLTPSLSVSASATSTTAGGAPVTLSATLTDASDPIGWTVESGPGSVGPSTGATVTYTPPATLAAQATATVRASAGSLSQTVAITVQPAAAAALAISPATLEVTAGAPAVTFTVSGSSGAVTWSLNGGPGALSATSGTSVTYTAPATVGATTQVLLTAATASATASATVTVKPAAAGLGVTPAAIAVTAGTSSVTFTATGASGAVTWSVNPGDPGKLSANTGTTVSYTPPASVASATVVTLTASAGGSTATAKITVNPGAPTTVTVTGIVLGGNLQAVANAPVVITGMPSTTTDSNGRFSVASVSMPYDVAVVAGAGGNPSVFMYQGLRRSDPTIYATDKLCGGRANLPGTSRTASIVGALSSSTASGQTTVTSFGSPDVITSVSQFGPAGNTVRLEGSFLIWWGPTLTAGTVNVLRYASATAPAYAFGAASQSVSDGQGSPPSTTLTLSSLPAQQVKTLVGTFQPPADRSVSQTSFRLRFASGDSTLLPLPVVSASVSYPTPAIAGATVEVSASTDSVNADQSTITRTGLAPDANFGTVAIPLPPAQQLPAFGDGTVTHATDFSWTAYANAIHVLRITPDLPPSPSYHIITAGTTARIPRTIGLSPNVSYNWSVEAYGPLATVDDAAAVVLNLPFDDWLHSTDCTTAKGTGSVLVPWQPRSNFIQAITANRQFTTAAAIP